jgi:hypothetical protein
MTTASLVASSSVTNTGIFGWAESSLAVTMMPPSCRKCYQPLNITMIFYILGMLMPEQLCRLFITPIGNKCTLPILVLLCKTKTAKSTTMIAIHPGVGIAQ